MPFLFQSVLQCYFVFIVFIGESYSLSRYELQIDVKRPIHETNPLSPSVATGVTIFEYGWIKYFNDTKFVKLAKALGPSYYRIGGTKADFVHFETDSEHQSSQRPVKPLSKGSVRETCETQLRDEVAFAIHKKWAEEQMIRSRQIKMQYGVGKTFHPITLTPSEWKMLNDFCDCVGWKLIFDLSIQYRDGNEWNSTNAQKLLNYSENRYHVNWELGNEPNSYHHKNETSLTAQQIAEGFIRLKNILSASSWWRNSEVFGPDLNRIGTKSAGKYLKTFLKHGGNALTGLTVHQYYLNGHIAVEGDFLKPSTLNKIIKQIKQIERIVNDVKPGLPIWIGETASAYGGGAPGLSNSYLDGFTWLDKLGMASKMGVNMVVRQTLLNSNYALLNDNFDPMPDYWLTLLYKTLVSHKVLNVSLSKCASNICKARDNGRLRVYSHCTSTRSGYSPGSIVVYFINLSKRQLRLVIEPYHNHLISADLYLLQPVAGNLTATSTQLNGVTLTLGSDNSIPPLIPRNVHYRTLMKGLKIPSFTYGFLVLKDINANACL